MLKLRFVLEEIQLTNLILFFYLKKKLSTESFENLCLNQAIAGLLIKKTLVMVPYGPG